MVYKPTYNWGGTTLYKMTLELPWTKPSITTDDGFPGSPFLSDHLWRCWNGTSSSKLTQNLIYTVVNVYITMENHNV